MGLGSNTSPFSFGPVVPLLSSLHEALMNLRWTPPARRKALDYPSRFLQAREEALYVLCVQFVFLVWQVVSFLFPLGNHVFNLRQQIFLTKTVFLAHDSHKEKRALCDMKTLARNCIYTPLQEAARLPISTSGRFGDTLANAQAMLGCVKTV